MNDLNIRLVPKKVSVNIEYCVPCDYSDEALSTAKQLIKNYQHVIDQLVFKMGSRGAFEVRVDDEVIFSKNALHRFPRPGEVLQLFREWIGAEVHTYAE